MILLIYFRSCLFLLLSNPLLGKEVYILQFSNVLHKTVGLEITKNDIVIVARLFIFSISPTFYVMSHKGFGPRC